ncbi:hypothetical protein [Natrinema sp. DC36]|uniref:hypothetical protein n=1 Tax=Natrinema sp. DC36 TaxID=2878680 RepID=UPI001CEFDBFD|nr:hypothetical protein [Natrinema sp. DC36]
MNGRHVAESSQTNEYPYLEQIHGEDPARFLEMNELTATARIRGIRDPELLEAYETVAKEITAGQYRNTILEAIDERKADLGIDDELAAEPTDSRATATDGGAVVEETPDEPAEPDDVHPDCKGLEAGQVLKLERADGTEYIFPAQPDAEEPFLCRSFDGEGDERTAEPIPLSLGEVASRPINDTDPKPVSEINTRAPTLAASNGGDSE